ncbi:MAG: phospholipase D-like domain-containing protein [Bacillota bacterium]|nr:phospholipase D-like domain-containing protein [Bacillota bacterium]
MNVKLDFKQGTFVSSKDTLGYQEVLDDFKNAQIIRIVTFNLSKGTRDDKLFNKLLELGETVDIQIITNIPSRFNWYATSSAGEYLRRAASTNIDAYLKKLNPDDFNAPIIPFFNFNNHAKIIGTENIVYIGSANFSNESAKNYETGVLISDKEFIKELYKSFFDNLKEESIPYFTDEFNKLRLAMLSILTRLVNHYDYILDTLFIFSERFNKYIFINDETGFSENDLYELRYDLYELEEIEGLIDEVNCDEYELEEPLNQIADIYSNININFILDLIGIDKPFYDFVRYSFQNAFDDCFEEYSGVAYDEYLEHYIEKASDDARDVLCGLCENAEEDIENLKLELESIINSIKEINTIISDNASKAINVDIDNTK